MAKPEVNSTPFDPNEAAELIPGVITRASPAEFAFDLEAMGGNYRTPEGRQLWLETRTKVRQRENRLRNQLPYASGDTLDILVR